MARETMSPPEELPAAELALLRGYRDEHAMPAAAKSRVGMRLESSHAAPGTARWVALGAAIAAVALLGWWLSTLRAETPLVEEAAPTQQAAFDADDDAPLREVSTRQPAPTPKAPPRAVVVDEPGPAPEPEPAPRPKKRVAKTPPPVESGPSALAQERELLGQAWAALARGAHEDALAKASVHGKRFPNGTLRVERTRDRDDRRVQSPAAGLGEAGRVVPGCTRHHAPGAPGSRGLCERKKIDRPLTDDGVGAQGGVSSIDEV